MHGVRAYRFLGSFPRRAGRVRRVLEDAPGGDKAVAREPGDGMRPRRIPVNGMTRRGASSSTRRTLLTTYFFFAAASKSAISFLKSSRPQRESRAGSFFIWATSL